MSRALFDQTLATRPRSKRSFGTVTFSVLLHAVALAVVLAWQFTSSIQGLVVASPLAAFAIPTVPTPPVVTPPPVRPMAPSAPAINPNAAPTEPAESITKEPATIPAPANPFAPIGTLVGPPGDVSTLFSPNRDVSGSINRPPPRPTTVRVGGDILPPTRLVYVPPVYPSIAQTARVEGEVALEATIDESGAVRNVVVQHSVPLLDRAAIEAVSKWRYSPTRLNGQPVSVIMLVRVRFTLK